MTRTDPHSAHHGSPPLSTPPKELVCVYAQPDEQYFRELKAGVR